MSGRKKTVEGFAKFATKGKGTLVSKIGEELRRAIQSGKFSPGEKLPSEVQLTETYGVSRTVVREAIAALRADGLVVARQGAGVFVLESSSVPFFPQQRIDQARVSSMIELLELRTAVEVEAAGLAAQRRSPAQEDRIFSCHAAVVACIEAQRPTSEEDFAFHLAIASATNNPRFAEFLSRLGTQIIPRAALQTESGDERDMSYAKRICAEHEAIVVAISNGDEEGAREAMRRHLKGSQARYRALLRSDALSGAARTLSS
jgi:GntR family transcriptional regulator, transcriptional repressor for pyruvate dehydrogenase complex